MRNQGNVAKEVNISVAGDKKTSKFLKLTCFNKAFLIIKHDLYSHFRSDLQIFWNI